MSLSAELSKPEYQTGTYAERLALLRSKVTPTIGRIQTGNLKNLEAIIASGLWRDKMADMRDAARAVLADAASTQAQKDVAQMRLKVVAGFHEAISEAKIANKADPEIGGHSINMDDPTVQLNFAAAQHPAVALITPAEAAQVMALATYQKPTWPDAKLRDVVAHFEPELTDVGEWVEVEGLTTNRLRLHTTEAMPEPTLVCVEMSESEDGVTWTKFKRVNHFYGVHQPDFYFANIPNNGLQRRVRVRGEHYRLTGTVKAV